MRQGDVLLALRRGRRLDDMLLVDWGIWTVWPQKAQNQEGWAGFHRRPPKYFDIEGWKN